MLSDMGITVVESEDPEEAPAQDGEEAEEEEPTSRAVATTPSLPAVTQDRAEPTERTDDPVRMYLRDMGSVELLSREGEIAIAKRIEAGREAMIAGLCESPLTFQAVINLARRAQQRQDPAARPSSIWSHLRRPRGQGRTPGRRPRRSAGRSRSGPGTRWGKWRRRRAASGGRAGGRRGLRERAFARGDGGRAQAQGARDLRQHRRHLQEAAQAAGQESRDAGCERAVHAPAAARL